VLPLLVYIASPYTLGNVAENVRRQIDAAHTIMDIGHCPIVPNLSHFMELVRSRPYEDWMARDFAIIKRCDMLLRLPGKSKGADREVDHALSLGLHVVYSMAELWAALNTKEKENK
jgi:hypothetical protein